MAIAWAGGRHTACACYRVRGPGGIGGDRLGRRTAHGVCLLQSAAVRGIGGDRLRQRTAHGVCLLQSGPQTNTFASIGRHTFYF